MERAKHTPSVWIATFDDWLIKAERLAVDEVMWVHDGRGIHYSDAQAALNAQYGKFVFQAGNHGKALFVERMRASSPEPSGLPGDGRVGR